jgi:UDP-N-acetylmuramate dehydrogenase
VFVNPDGESAGRLIDEAGLKGARSGGARVSDVHANFIVNEGGATAGDVWSLIRRIRSSVKDLYGIELQTEIKFLGTFEEA